LSSLGDSIECTQPIRDLEFDRCTLIVPDSPHTVNQSASVDESVNIQPTASTTPNLTGRSHVM
jgi:hypothetical protein